MTSRFFAARTVVEFGVCLSVGACSRPEFHIPRPVPPAVHEHVIDAPAGHAWEASLRALARLGLTPAETNPDRGSVVTDFRTLERNSARHRSSGIARFTIERDIYSAGRWRLLVNLTPEDTNRTQVQVSSEVQAQIERRGEVQYREKGEQESLQSHRPPADWQTLTSNGVLEDEFLAALVAELSGNDASQP